MRERLWCVLFVIALLFVLFGCGLSDPADEIRAQCPELGSCQYDYKYLDSLYGPATPEPAPTPKEKKP